MVIPHMGQTERYTRGLEEHTLIDADVHLRISIEQVAPYLEQPYKGKAEQGVKPSDAWDRYKSGRIERRNHFDTAEAIREDLCDGLSVDHPIINPSLSFLPRIPQTDYAVALMRAYNDNLMDILDQDDDFYGLIHLAMQAPEQAVEEIERLGDEPQIVGVYIISMGSEVPLGDPRYHGVYEAARDKGLTITYHPHAGVTKVDFPKQNYGFNEYVSINTLGFMWGQMQTIVSLLEQGVPVKYPDLDFVFLEGGPGWVPGLMFRLNKKYAARRDEMPALEKTPEEYMRDFYYASQPLGEPVNHEDMGHLLDALDAPNTLMFASDYPHWDFDNPSDLFKHLRTKYSHDEQKQILGGNAAEAYNLSI